jgi:hypothetical protein
MFHMTIQLVNVESTLSHPSSDGRPIFASVSGAVTHLMPFMDFFACVNGRIAHVIFPVFSGKAADPKP